MSREEAENTEDFAGEESGVPEVTADDSLELGVGGERHGVMKHLMETDGPVSLSPVNTGF